MTSANRASGSVHGGVARVEIMRHCSSTGKGRTTRGKERKSSEGDSERVDVESSTLRTILDEFTVAGRQEQGGSYPNFPSPPTPEALPKQELPGEMRGPPWSKQFEALGTSACPL